MVIITKWGKAKMQIFLDLICEVQMEDLVYNRLKKLFEYNAKISVSKSSKAICICYDSEDIVAAKYMQVIKDYIAGIEEVIESKDCLKSSHSECATKLILPTNEFKKITVLSKKLLHGQLPFEGEFFEPWFHCHFINIYYCCKSYLNYTDEHAFDKIYDCLNLDYNNLSVFNNERTFIDSLNKGYYIYAWIDNFFNSGSKYFEKYHDVHPVLIYGYNLDEQLYYGCMFDTERSLYYINMPMDEIHLALESAPLYFNAPSEIPFKLMKIKEFQDPYEDYSGRFLKELHDYINSTGSLEYVYYLHKHHNDHRFDYFGLEVTRQLINGLNNPTDYLVFDYRLIHLIVENKKLITESLIYFNKGIYSSKELSTHIKSYEELVSQYDKMRILYMKQSIKENKMETFYPQPKSKQIIDNMTEKLSNLVKQEEELLKKVISLLIDKMVLDIHQNKINMVVAKDLIKGKDESGFYYEYKWHDSIYLESLGLYSFYNLLDGKILLSDGREINTSSKDSIYSHAIYPIKESRVSWIRFYPSVHIEGKEESFFRISAYSSNLLKTSKAFASSIFSERDDETFFPENTYEDTLTSWSPEIDDKKRCLYFYFKDEIAINTLIIRQNFFANRIREFVLEYKLSEDNWQELYCFNGSLGVKQNRFIFETTKILALRLRIIKTIMDTNGFDLPQIDYLAVFKDPNIVTAT